ncbi:amidohydrolase [Gilvibacter sp.]|uniref:amidohydrolase n=1 Tax=Gilvibacter sp. TaxID=2729997 RepID=UPI003F49E23B
MRILSLLLVCSLISCKTEPEKISAELIVTNANIYTVDEQFRTANAFAVGEGGVILGVGADFDITAEFESENVYNAEGKTIVPGLIDAHAHLLNLGVGMQEVDLVGTTSATDVIARVKAFQKENQPIFLSGRGWDQNDWEVKEFPTKELLDDVFPDVPVALRRIDGHALWVNSKALELAGITADTKMSGGEVILRNGAPSGILVDAPMRLVDAVRPEKDTAFYIKSLKDAEDFCLSYGLTTVNDAGLDRFVIEMIDSLQQAGTMKLRLYAMVSNAPENLDHYLNNGIVKTDRLNVRSIKVYGDGALGSRGAALRAPYSDQHDHYGAMITTEEELMALAKRIHDAGYQMNTHAIGDSANIAVLRAYSNVLKDQTDARWKVEHAQIVSVADFDYFSKNIIPSVQPTHATSDMYWAEERVGPDRIQGAYSFKTLLDKAGLVALGTDFPVEQVNPMLTFYAAVARQDTDGYPDGGFLPEQKLSREEALKGMTIWAAYSNFEEEEKGSIEVGKLADFTVLSADIMTIDDAEIPKVEAVRTYINGELVYEKK